MEYDVLYSCHSCNFKTHLITEMREHVKTEHGTKPQTEEDLVWHVVNEWADELCNAKVWLLNVKDGITSFDDALLAVQDGITRCRAVGVETMLQIKEMKHGR